MIARIVASVSLACFLSASPYAQAQDGVKVLKEYKGQASAEGLGRILPSNVFYFPGPTAFKKFWDATGLKEPIPQVDFEKELVLFVYSSEAKDLTMQLKRSPKGDLRVTHTAKRGDSPKIMSFHVAIVSREGVNTVNGKKIVIKK